LNLQMSYTEYLRRKASSAPVVVDMRPKLDASSYTRQQRLIAAGQSYNTTKAVIGNIDDMISSVSRDNRNSFPATLVSTTKTTAGSVPDASSRTDFLGGQAILEARQTAKPTRVLMNSKSTNSGMTVTSSCRVIPEPAPQTSGVIGSNSVQKGAGDWVRLNKDCVVSGTIGEPHEPGMRGTPQFVDDTISLNSGTFRIGTGSSSTTNKTGSTPESSGCAPANHTHPALVPYAAWAPRPRKGAGGLQVSVQPRPGDARKVGGLVPSDHLKYVEAHHGNDLRVNPRRIPVPFQIPAGTPAQLKINDPKRLS
jgi:hypothetical protein